MLKKQEEAGILNLSYKHKKAIVDFISCAPGISAKAAPTPYTISQGFKLNGMVDENIGFYPYFYKIIGTVCQKLTQDEIKLCEDSFDELFDCQVEHGHIPEELFDKLGFP